MTMPLSGSYSSTVTDTLFSSTLHRLNSIRHYIMEDSDNTPTSLGSSACLGLSQGPTYHSLTLQVKQHIRRAYPGTAEKPIVLHPGFEPYGKQSVNKPWNKTESRDPHTICNIVQHRRICIQRRVQKSNWALAMIQALLVETIDNSCKYWGACRGTARETKSSFNIHLISDFSKLYSSCERITHRNIIAISRNIRDPSANTIIYPSSRTSQRSHVG